MLRLLAATMFVRPGMVRNPYKVYTFCLLPARQNYSDGKRFNMTSKTIHRHLFPSLLAKPLSLVPGRLHATLISGVLNQLLAGPIHDGDLDFMSGRYLRVEVVDAGIRFDLCFDSGRLRAAGSGNSPELIFRGNVHDFLLLATRREDSDSLFFQRRLKIEGDTDLGLAIKNFLDAIEMESLPWHRQVNGFLGRAVNLYERIT